MITIEDVKLIQSSGGVLSTGQAAKVLGISLRDMRRLAVIADGIQPMRPTGRRWRWSTLKVLDYRDYRDMRARERALAEAETAL